MKAKVRATGEIIEVSLYSSSGCIGNWQEQDSNISYPTCGLDFDVAPKPIDWEQRRYEIAKDCISSAISVSLLPIDGVCRLDIKCAIEIADDLIKQLKGGNQ